MSDKLSIIVGNVRYDNSWQTISLFNSMENIAGTISLTTTDFFPDKKKLWQIFMGDEYQVFINNELIGTGFIERIVIDYTGSGNVITFEGRDKTCDLVDCHFVANAKSWENLRVIDIIARLCEPFNITVIGEPSVGLLVNQTIDNFVADEGKTILELIMKLTQKRGILAISKGDGDLTLTKATQTDFHPSTLDQNNVLSGTIEQDDTERFSEYIVKSSTPGSEILKSIQALKRTTEPEGRSLKDVRITRNRPYVLLIENADDQLCKNKAIFEKNNRMGQSRNIEYIVEGWTQEVNGEVWKTNRLVFVDDDLLGIHTDMLLTEVEFIGDETEGLTTRLKLVPKETFSLIDESKFKTEFDGGILQQIKISKSKVVS